MKLSDKITNSPGAFKDVDPKDVGGILTAVGAAVTLAVKVIQDWKKK